MSGSHSKTVRDRDRDPVIAAQGREASLCGEPVHDHQTINRAMPAGSRCMATRL